MLKRTCADCSRETFDDFPGGLCLACYKLTPEATAPLTQAGLEAMTNAWRGRPAKPGDRDEATE